MLVDSVNNKVIGEKEYEYESADNFLELAERLVTESFTQTTIFCFACLTSNEFSRRFRFVVCLFVCFVLSKAVRILIIQV